MSPPLADLPYRPRLGLILLVSGFFGLGVGVLGHKYAATGETDALVGAVLSGGFVLMGALLLAMRTLRPQRVRVFADHLEVPVGRLGQQTRRMPLGEIEGVDILSVNGQVFATLKHAAGPCTLHRSMFPENRDFDDVLALVETGVWRGAPVSNLPVEPVGPGDATPDAPRTVAAARAGAARPWWGLGLKLGALAAFCGGPLRATDALAPTLGRDGAFVAAFVPIGLLLLGAFAVLEDEPTPWTRAVVGLGGLGALAILLSDLWALLLLTGSTARGDDGLIAVGSLLGLGIVAVYGWAAARFWARR